MSDLQTAIATLRNGLAVLAPKDRSFAESLLASARASRGLSEKQAYWAGVLAQRVTAPMAEPDGYVIGTVLVDLFDRANQKLKMPKMLFATDCATLRLSRAGQMSRFPGALNVTSTDGDYEGRTWYGRLGRDGEFTASRKFDKAETDAVAAALVAIAADPAGMAAAYGRRTGICCFCSTRLTDPRSTEVGYGKICASHYGLVWG